MNFFGKKPGFTLFELMVTISMVVLLLTMSSVVYRNTNKRTELILTAHQVAAMARLAESYAASAKEIDASVKQNVWGLFVDKSVDNKIIMFVDKDNNGVYTDETENYRVFNLPKQIKLEHIFSAKSNTGDWQEIGDYQNGGTVKNGRAIILFTPPDPKTVLCEVKKEINVDVCSAHVDELRLVFKDDLNSSVKDVKFNFFGLIDVR